MYLKVSGKDTPSAPEIKSEGKEWKKSNLVKVEKDAEVYGGVKYYQYCVREDTNYDKCKWKKTETKSVVIDKTGEYNVVFRAVGKNLVRGNLSNKVHVKIDNIAPEIESVETKGIKVKVKATDKHSGVKRYLYKIDEGIYTAGNSEYTLEGEGKHKLTIRVEDEVGNYTEVETEIDIDKQKEEQEKIDNGTYDEELRKIEEAYNNWKKEQEKNKNNIALFII